MTGVDSQRAAEIAAEFIKRWEGLCLRAYQCSAGKWTIGWGSTGGVSPGDVITEAEAEARFARDLERKAALHVRTLAERLPFDLAPEEAAALMSLAFNIGGAALLNSTAAKRLAAGDRAGAAEALTWWNKVTDPKTGKKRVEPGLVKRRAEERALFLSAKETAHDHRGKSAEAEANEGACAAADRGAEPDQQTPFGRLLSWLLGLVRPALTGARR